MNGARLWSGYPSRIACLASLSGFFSVTKELDPCGTENGMENSGMELSSFFLMSIALASLPIIGCLYQKLQNDIFPNAL